MGKKHNYTDVTKQRVKKLDHSFNRVTYFGHCSESRTTNDKKRKQYQRLFFHKYLYYGQIKGRHTPPFFMLVRSTLFLLSITRNKWNTITDNQ